MLKLVLGLCLGGLAHPCSLADALGQCCLQVADNLQHALLAACREVFLAVHLSDGIAEDGVYERVGTLPAGKVCRLAAQCLAELELRLAELVGHAA